MNQNIKIIYNQCDNRNKYTKNEIRVFTNGVCEIDVYDKWGNYKDTGLFSEIDLDNIKIHKWYLDSVGYLTTTIDGKKVRMHRFLFPNQLIDHINENKKDNRRENLQKISSALNIAKIPNKMFNPHGITGLFLTPSNTWQASIEVNKKKKTKNFKNKELAILQRYIWELNAWRKNAPQFQKIKENYPLLCLAIENPQVTIKEDPEYVLRFMNLFKESPYCPCQRTKTEDTKCMCKEFREQQETGLCHCGLYKKIVDNS